MNPDSVVHAPRWVKIVVIFWMTAGAALGVFLCVRLIGEAGSRDILLVTVTFVQVSLSGAALSLVLFFSSRKPSYEIIERASRRFLREEIVNAFRRMDAMPVKLSSSFTDDDSQAYNGAGYIYEDGVFATYFFWVDDRVVPVRISLNVRRITVIFFVSSEVQFRNGSELEGIRSVFLGALDAGYTFADSSEISGVRSKKSNIWGMNLCEFKVFNSTLSNEFLNDPVERLYWAQDIMLMVRAFIVEGKRSNTLCDAAGFDPVRGSAKYIPFKNLGH